MGEYNIFRRLSNTEKSGLTELGQRDLMNLFLKDLANKQQEYQKKKIPFDTYGARIDFEDRIKSKISEISAVMDPSKINTKIDFGDFSEYAKVDRFTYIGKIEVRNTRLVAGIKQEVISGMRYNFVCKERGNKLSISVTNEEVKDMTDYVNKTYLKKEVKDKVVVEDEVVTEKTTKSK